MRISASGLPSTWRVNSLLLLTVAANLGVGIIIPLLPTYLQSQSIGMALLGVPFFTLVIGRLAARLFAAELIVRMGHRALLVGCFTLYAATFALYLAATSLWQFTALRFIEGVIEGMLAVVLQDLSIAYASKMQPDERTRFMGRFAAAFGLGFLIGPVVGSLLSEMWDTSAIFPGAMVIACAAAGGAVFTSRETTRPLRPVLAAGLRNSVLVLGLYGPQSLRRVAFLSLMILLPLHLTQSVQLTATSVGVFFTLSAVLTTTGMPLAARLERRWGTDRCIASGLAVMALSLVLMGLTRDVATFTVLFIIETAGFVVMLPPAMTAFAEAVQDSGERTRWVSFAAFATELISLIPAAVLPLLYVWHPLLSWSVVGLAAAVSLVCFRNARAVWRGDQQLVSSSVAIGADVMERRL